MYLTPWRRTAYAPLLFLHLASLLKARKQIHSDQIRNLRYQKSILHWKRNSENRLTNSCFPKSKSENDSAYFKNKYAFLVLTEPASSEGTYFLWQFCNHQHYLETTSKTLATWWKLQSFTIVLLCNFWNQTKAINKRKPLSWICYLHIKQTGKRYFVSSGGTV